MNALVELFNKIETPEFSAGVNVASSLKIAVSISQRIQETRELVKQLSLLNILDVQVLLIERVAEISKRSIDLMFESPWDVALLILLLVVKEVCPNAFGYCCRLANSAPNTHWTREFLKNYEVHTHR